MSALRDRLRGLRAQAGHSVAAAAPVPAPRKTTTEDLRWLLGVRARSHARPTTPFPVRDRELFGEEIAPGLRYTEEHVDWPGPPAPIDTRFARREDRIDPARLLHFDTETTGLAGGTGTRAFMIGAADWLGGRLRLRQLTITTMAAEPAMLRTFAEWLAPESVLVSYNGKCYDAPLLATRYRLARLANPLAGLDHLDLLHPVRRHWKGQWENCRLATAERQLLGVLREDDLPGSEAPAAWLTYLRGGPATNLRRVAEHNAQDLKSLAGVLLRLSALGAEPVPSAVA
ncbi:MAG: ribonuclease H-like domain-containing protein [Dyella sp.]|uniref:ribonuclease H-like domain-containing protein n=1 Tax=Dyella sp. TaxID=1869338 RepID=UPI003F8059D5